MTRYVKRKRKEIQHKKYRGFMAQFVIFLILRSIDLAASISVLGNAWKHSSDWDSINDTLFNMTKQVPDTLNSRTSRSIVDRSINPRNVELQNSNFGRNSPRLVESFLVRNANRRRFLLRNLESGRPDHQNVVHANPEPLGFEPRNFDSRNVDSRNFNFRKLGTRNMTPRRLSPGERGPRINNTINLKRRSLDSKVTRYIPQYPTTLTIEQCQDTGKWDKKKVHSKISEYKIILGLTLFFNIVSLSIFLTHLAFWIATIKIFLQDGTEYKTRVTRLTRNSLLSLTTAIFRDVPLSCLNVELLALRSGHEGLACVACIFAGRCPPVEYVENSVNLAKSLLYFNYFIMLTNSLWKGVSGFYRLSRFKEFNIYFIRACASIVFAFLYCIATFTPAMFMFIYRYFATPGLNAPFLQDLAERLVVIGAVIWVIFGSAVICFPILYLIRLSAD